MLTTPTITVTKGTSTSATLNPTMTSKAVVYRNPVTVTTDSDYSSPVTDESETGDGSGDGDGNGSGSGDGEGSGADKKKKKKLGHDRYGLRCHLPKPTKASAQSTTSPPVLPQDMGKSQFSCEYKVQYFQDIFQFKMALTFQVCSLY